MTRRGTVALALFAAGMTAIVGQVLLSRELLATLFGNELLLGLILAAWLGWGALGASLVLAGRRAAWRERAFAAGLIAAAVLLPAQMALARDLRTLLGVTPGSILELGPLVLTVTLVLAPLCLCLGALFSIGVRTLVEQGGTPGRAYVWDSAGGCVGGALFSFALVRWLNPFQIAFLVGGADFAAATLLLAHVAPAPAAGSHRRLVSLYVLAVMSVLAVLSIAAVPLGRAAQQATLRLEWPNALSGTAQNLLFSGDSPYGRIAVQARGSQRIFYTDGSLAFDTQSTFPEEVAHLALLAHPSPRSILLIGGGIAGDLREILKHPIESVTYVELDPLMIQAARDYLPAEDAAVLDDPRVHLVLTDGRAFVATDPGIETTSQAHPGGYDVIIMDLPEPTTGALNRFYTVEFFSQARRLLRPGGILAFGLPSAENYWNPELARRNASVYRTLNVVFPDVNVLPGEHSFFLASEEPVQITADVLSERMAQRHIQTRWVTPAYLRDLLTGDRFAEAQRRVKEETGIGINRDLRPLSYAYSLAQWLARFYPALRQAFEGSGSIEAWWLAFPLVLLLLTARWKRSWGVHMAVAGVGLAQMLLELVLLFAFQALHGSLYVEVGLIITTFMGGLALGGAMGNRLSRLPAGAQPARQQRTLLGVLAGMAAYSIALPFLFTAPLRQGGLPQAAFPGLALIGGVLGGMVFPLASCWQTARTSARVTGESGGRDGQYSPGELSAIGGSLYAADLAGGCLGALLGAALFIPILGIPATCAAIALLAVAALLALV